MYSVMELSEMYELTRVTVYKYLKHDDIQEYLTKDNKGLKLQQEGLNVFNNIIASANVKPKSQEVNTDIYNSLTVEKDKQIDLLKQQIEELRADKERLNKEFNADKERLYIELREQRQALMLNSPDNKKGFFKRLFS